MHSLFIWSCLLTFVRGERSFGNEMVRSLELEEAADSDPCKPFGAQRVPIGVSGNRRLRCSCPSGYWTNEKCQKEWDKEFTIDRKTDPACHCKETYPGCQRFCHLLQTASSPPKVLQPCQV
eukprot:Skav235867  [mRNA]  locus=scaffold1693:344313:345502:- [translate_table: standard]